MTKLHIRCFASLAVLASACAERPAVHGGAGSGGLAGGQAGRGGAGGSGGGSGGAGGADTGALRVTFVMPFPTAQMAGVGLHVAVDSQDGVVVLGPSTSTPTTDPGPTLTWIASNGSMRQKTFANERTPFVMALDGANAVWLAGLLEQPTSFGGTTIQPVNEVLGMVSAYYLVKLNPDGSNAFTKTIRRTDLVFAGSFINSITIDGAGNAYVVGSLLAGGSASVFVTKFSPAGTQLIDRMFAGSTSEASPDDVAVAPNGEVVIAGRYNGVLDMGGGTSLTSSSGLNGFIAALNAVDFTASRAFTFRGNWSAVSSIDVTSTGSYRVAGLIADGGIIGDTTVHAHINGSPFVAELAASTGQAAWVQVTGERGLVFDATTNSVDRTFAGGRIEGATWDGFLAAASGPAPTLSMPLRVASPDGNGATHTAADKHGGVWVGGEVSGMATIGTVAIGSPDASYTNFLVHLEP